jgi:gas vesicle protein
MKYVSIFMIGALIGGLVGLLFAPSSGEELRMNIKTRANSEYEKLQSEMQKGMQEMRTRMDKMGGDVQAAASQVEEIV